MAIRVRDLSKRYDRRGAAPYQTLRDGVAAALHAPFRRLLSHGAAARARPRTAHEFWALNDVSFDVHQGEVLGIIGHNGAGKSTLLKILAGIVEPTRGRAAVRGRLASLLEVGTGFHPELSGRENVFLNGAILGMSRAEIRRKLDEIVAFAEVEPFVDTPVKHYSSGMYLRLAFAVAAHLEPEILLIDEVLAVGDAAFQKKCLGKMSEVASIGRTALFVSHNLAAVQQLTQRSLLLQHGEVTAIVRANRDVDRFRFSVTIFQADGTPVGNVFGPEAHALKAGETATFRMTLADMRLARGSYHCALATGLGSHLDQRIEFDIVLDVVHFEVLGPLRADGVMSEWFSVWGPIRFKQPQLTRVE